MFNRFEFEVLLANTFGSSIGSIANVINAFYANPEAKLLGLYFLAKEKEVEESTNCNLF